MGLDKDDTIVKRRMAQKMEFLAEDVAAAREPTTRRAEGLVRDEHDDASRSPARVTFRHLYFSPDRRGKQRAGRTRRPPSAGSPANRRDSPDAAALGDPFMFQDYYADRAPDQVAKDFGPPFAKALFVQKPGAWAGPIESGYGWHLVFVDSLTPERMPRPSRRSSRTSRRRGSATQQAAGQGRRRTRRCAQSTSSLLPAPPAHRRRTPRRAKPLR